MYSTSLHTDILGVLYNILGIGKIYDKTFETIIHAISTYAQPHFAYYMPTKLRLESTIGKLILMTETHYGEPTFEFVVELPSGLVFPKHMLSVVLSEFSPARPFKCLLV